MCSATCGGGTRKRTRECDMESYGDLTAPCEGANEDEENCHEFDCLPYGKSQTFYNIPMDKWILLIISACSR